MTVKRLLKASVYGLACVVMFFIMSIPFYCIVYPYNLLVSLTLVFFIATYGIYKEG